MTAARKENGLTVAMLLNCGSFEGYFTGFQGQTVETYLQTYRNDWSWYYGKGLVENGIKPIFYIPSLRTEGLFETDTGISVRFLPLARWYRPFENKWLKRAARRNRFSLYLDERLNTIAFMGPLIEALSEDSADILYVQEYWSARFDHIVSRVQLPVTGADHGGVSKGVLKVRKKAAFAASRGLYCQTVEECSIVEAHGGKAILQTNGCDTDEFRPAVEPARVKSILAVARLINRQKRTSDLIEVLGLLDSTWRLDLVGTGPDLEMLQALAKARGVADRVIFHGFQSRSDVRRKLQTCGVFAMPSANEAVALAALEAMACGCAVVLSRIRSFETLVEDGRNGRLVEVGDKRALAEAIEAAWMAREALGTAARQTVREKYDTKVLYKTLAETLRAQAQPGIV